MCIHHASLVRVVQCPGMGVFIFFTFLDFSILDICLDDECITSQAKKVQYKYNGQVIIHNFITLRHSHSKLRKSTMVQ